MADPWNEGHQARIKDEDVNPYELGTDEHSGWAAGWADMDEHLRERDHALQSIGWY